MKNKIYSILIMLAPMLVGFAIFTGMSYLIRGVIPEMSNDVVSAISAFVASVFLFGAALTVFHYKANRSSRVV